MGTVMLYAKLRELADGHREINVPWSDRDSVGEVVTRLVHLHPDLEGHIVGADRAIVRYVSILLDGRDVRYRDGLSTPLHEESILAIFPPSR